MNLRRLLEAASFAAARHATQTRKDKSGSPYINHPLKVAAMLAGPGGIADLDLLIAALLHDVVEDTETCAEEIRDRYGERVAGIVSEVTDDKTLPRARRKAIQVETAREKSPAAKELKIADKICNVNDIDEDAPAGWPLTRKLEYLDWSRQVVDGCRGVNEGLEREFDEAVEKAAMRLGDASV
ncbi:MAG: HD domain-containing protein [Planctomycetota bacterium]